MKVVLNLREASRSNRGFILIEFILSLCFISILLYSIFTILNYSMDYIEKNNEIDDILLNGRYAIDYIRGEILSADKIIDSSKIKNLDFEYPDNIGFVIMIKINDNVRYITYYKKNNELIRLSCKGVENRYPESNSFSGYNQICEYLFDIGKIILDEDNELIELFLKMGSKPENCTEFRSTIFIRCPMDC